MITQDDLNNARRKAEARDERSYTLAIADALADLKVPGELDELAQGECVSIEADGTIGVYCCDNHGEEAREFTPDALRSHAFELLAIAELAEASYPVRIGAEWELRNEPERLRNVIRIAGDYDAGEGGWLYEYVMVNGDLVVSGKKKRITDIVLRDAYVPSRER